MLSIALFLNSYFSQMLRFAVWIHNKIFCILEVTVAVNWQRRVTDNLQSRLKIALHRQKPLKLSKNQHYREAIILSFFSMFINQQGI